MWEKSGQPGACSCGEKSGALLMVEKVPLCNLELCSWGKSLGNIGSSD